MAESQPGFVYISSTPAFPGWFKVGRTTKPPHLRAKDLSSAGVPHPFRIHWARPFDNCIRAEQRIHKILTQRLGRRRRIKEFFQAPLDELVSTLTDHQSEFQSVSSSGSYCPYSEDKPGGLAEDFFESEEWLLENKDQAEQLWATGGAPQKTLAFEQMEKLSQQGLGSASWTLGEWIYQLNPGSEGPFQASWFFDRAEQQGLVGGRMMALWMRSWHSDQDHQSWLSGVAQEQRQGRLQSCGVLIDILDWERKSWVDHPEREEPFIRTIATESPQTH